jgi:hypothetical protein
VGDVAVSQVAVPPAARGRSDLGRIDYEDAFLVDGGSANGRTGEQWARAVLEEAPLTTRHSLRSGWRSLGLQLDSPRWNRHVLGWGVRQSTEEFALLAADSRLGLRAELLFERREDGLLFATFVQKDNWLGRVVWAGIEPVHRPVVRQVLERAAQAGEAAGC